MGEIYIKFSFNIETGEKEIIIEYEAEPDMTTVEHERKHRAIVEQLLGKGIIGKSELNRIKLKAISKPKKEKIISNTSEDIAEIT